MFKIFSKYICLVKTFKMQLLEVSCAVRHIYIYMSLGAKGLNNSTLQTLQIKQGKNV